LAAIAHGDYLTLSYTVMDPSPQPRQPDNFPKVTGTVPDRKLRRALGGFCICAILAGICFSAPLYRWASFALDSDLYSHVLLIPFVSAYLIWWNRKNLALDSKPAPAAAAVTFACAVAGLLLYWLARRAGWVPPVEDYLAATLFCLALFLLSGAFLFLGPSLLRSAAFPAGFLVLAIPFPTGLMNWIVTGLQHGSAEAAYWLLRLTGMPVLRDGTAFKLPGFSMEVAPQCSGIHSTLVLFITSLVAAYLLLRSPWSRAALGFAVLPLALLRNGLRILTIGQLCVQISPDMIDSYIHRRGGPIFFVLSLVPFFLLLIWLRKLEKRHGARDSQAQTI
jgi:exosortase C (VPDSG-CTERM-specific)